MGDHLKTEVPTQRLLKVLHKQKTARLRKHITDIEEILTSL